MTGVTHRSIAPDRLAVKVSARVPTGAPTHYAVVVPVSPVMPTFPSFADYRQLSAWAPVTPASPTVELSLVPAGVKAFAVFLATGAGSAALQVESAALPLGL